MYHVHCNWQTTDMYTNIATGTGNPCTSARGKIMGMSVLHRYHYNLPSLNTLGLTVMLDIARCGGLSKINIILL